MPYCNLVKILMVCMCNAFSEPGVARAKGIAQILLIIQIKKF